MGWRDIVELLEQVEGKIETILPDKLQAATATGKGPPDVQKRIAQAMYKRRHRKDRVNAR